MSLEPNLRLWQFPRYWWFNKWYHGGYQLICLISRPILIASRHDWYRSKGLFKGFPQPLRLWESLKNWWRYGWIKFVTYSLHLKHSTTITSCLLIILSSTPHYITLLFNTSNLFWGMIVPFSPSFLFLQLQARCPNFLQHQHNFLFLASNFSLSLVREHLSLSKLLMSCLYWIRDIVLCL